MVISTYQVNNVLRVYKGQLRQGQLSNRANTEETIMPDRISISSEAKRKAVIDRIASDVYNRITQNGPHDDVEKKVFEKLENEYGGHLTIAQESQNELHFKEINEHGETIHLLSLEDSKFLSHKLKEITKETVDQNMF